MSEHPESPFDSASSLSKLIFLWPKPLLDKGKNKVLVEEDLPAPSREDDAASLGGRVKECWEQEKLKEHPSLLRATINAFAWTHGWLGILLILESPLRIWQAKLLGYLVSYFVDGGDSSVELYNNGYFVSGMIICCGIVVMLCHHQYFFRGYRFGMQLRIAFTSLIYDKAVKLHMRSFAKASTGRIVNLASQDVETFQLAGIFLHFTYQPPMEALVILYFGYQEVGVAFVAGWLVILLLVPLQTLFSSLIRHNRCVTTGHSDERIKLINQALVGARVMKMNGWEWGFRDLIQKVRALEVASLMRTNYLKAINESIFFASPNIVACITFNIYVRTGGVLTPGKLFTVLSLFAVVQFSMTKFFSLAVQYATEGVVSLGRIQDLLEMEEIQDKRDIDVGVAADGDTGIQLQGMNTSNAGASGTEVVNFKDVSISWQDSEGTTDHGVDSYVLADLSFSIQKGEFVVIVGPVGCSKTSLLLSILGELEAVKGRVVSQCTGSARTGYCAQEPWIVSNTVKENILFGNVFDEKWYVWVVQQCALEDDYRILPMGDQTVIGDRGVTLSGGQRARIGLARSLYASKLTAHNTLSGDAHTAETPSFSIDPNYLFILDDPLSAVDPHVGSHLFNKVLCASEISSCTRILVTHQVQYLSSPHISRIMVLLNGRMIAFDSYDALLSSGKLADCLQVIAKDEERRRSRGMSALEDELDLSIPAPPSRKHSNSMEEILVQPALPVESITTKGGTDGSQQKYNKVPVDEEQPVDEENAPKQVGTTTLEDSETGNVKKATYMGYGGYMGGVGTGVVLFLFLAWAQVMIVMGNYWLSKMSTMSSDDQKSSYQLNVYITIVCVGILASLVRSSFTYKLTSNAARLMHDDMLLRVLRAPLLFFDSNPAGRVLNRFSKDVGFTDNQLPEVFFDFCQCTLMVLSAIVVVGLGSFYIFIFILPLAIYFVRLREFYMKTSREVKRLDAGSRSPVFSHISESLDGLITIRASQRLKDFMETSKTYLNNNTRAFFAFIAGTRWLGFNLDAMTIVFLAITTLGSVLAHELGAPIHPEILGVGIMYVIQLTALFQWTVRLSTEVENFMISVERILAYCRLPQEAALTGADAGGHGGTAATAATVTMVGTEWPSRGRIVAKDLVCTYRTDLPSVLRGISFVIEPKQRVGIVGRTGAGKSSLISVLLRMIDVQSGSVSIDGVDIANVGLHDLRPKISVIPQQPFLFMGSVRQNLDMFSQHTDLAIWNALNAVSLKQVVISKYVTECGSVGEEINEAQALNTLVAENGANFSLGERQLLCLCRAMLQKNYVLIMDEATANVDMETDATIQSAIRKEFSQATVIMIAHRLATVMDCDMIMVLGEGRMLECGHPHELLQDAGGALSSMIKDSGALAASLAALALKSWNNRK